MASPRLSEQRSELIDRSREIAFSWQGEPYTGYAGDTIASALYAAGVRVFSRSFKYHRPRGLMCCGGACPNCLVKVGDTPTVKACMTPITGGMQVQHINAWPSLERDALHSLTKVTPGFGMQVGFYYKTFIRPKWAWKYYERFLRGAAGLGQLDPDHRRSRRFEKVHRHVDVLVIGGGHSGLEAAIAAAEQGKDVALVEEGLALGGLLSYAGPDAADTAAKLAERAREVGVHVLQPAYAGGVYEGNLVPVYQGDTMHRFRAAEVVLAGGTLEQPLVFEKNDLPGVMLGGAARRLVNQFRVAPGEQAVVVCSDDAGIDAAIDLANAGIHVEAVADTRTGAPSERLANANIQHLTGFAPVAAKGSKAVSGITVANGSERRSLSADLVLMSGGRVGQLGFLTQAGGSIKYDRERRVYVPDRVPEGVRVEVDPVGTTEAIPAKCGSAKGKQFVCFCEDVTTKDVGQSIQEGFASLELSKRYTTVTMGPCQGRMCHRNSGLLMAAELGIDPDAPAGRCDHRAAAAPPHQLLDSGRARLRAGQAHRDPPLARRARRKDAVGRRLEARLRLRHARRRDRRGARVAGADRRLDAGQADRARA